MNDTLHNETKRVVDNIAGHGTSDKVEGATTETVGEGQQALGEATGNKSLQAEGVKNELAGNAQQVVGEAKEGLQNLGESIQRGVNKAVEATKDALHDANNKH